MDTVFTETLICKSSNSSCKSQDRQCISSIFRVRKRRLAVDSPMSKTRDNCSAIRSPPVKMVKSEEVEQEIVWRPSIREPKDQVRSGLSVPSILADDGFCNNDSDEPSSPGINRIKIAELLERFRDQLRLGNKSSEEDSGTSVDSGFDSASFDVGNQLDDFLSQIRDEDLYSCISHASFVHADVDGVVSKRLLQPNNDVPMPSPIVNPDTQRTSRLTFSGRSSYGCSSTIDESKRSGTTSSNNLRRNLFGVPSAESPCGISPPERERSKEDDHDDQDYFNDDFNDVIANLSAEDIFSKVSANDVVAGDVDESRSNQNPSNSFELDDVDWISITAAIKEMQDEAKADPNLAARGSDVNEDFQWDDSDDMICAAVDCI